jgi:hypothetical protein
MELTEQRPPRFVELTARMPLVPILLAIGGVTLVASLFATWFEIRQGAFTGVESPSRQQIRELAANFDESGWEFFGGGDIALFVLGLGLAALGIYDAARHEVPHPLLAVLGLACAIALVVVVTDGFNGDRVTLVEGTLGEAAGTVIVDRTRAGGQWVAVIGLVVALAGLAAGWRERRPSGSAPAAGA